MDFLNGNIPLCFLFRSTGINLRFFWVFFFKIYLHLNKKILRFQYIEIHFIQILPEMYKCHMSVLINVDTCKCIQNSLIMLENKFQVLIPVFALGRAQELCILLESYWDRMNIKVPIYFSLGLTEKVGTTVWLQKMQPFPV